MAMTDPIADLLTRIRNAQAVEKRSLDVPHSKLKSSILKVLKESGFISEYASEMVGGHATLRVQLKYGPEGEKLINHIHRVSKPGRRVYVGVDDIPRPLGGLGLAILSTSAGVISHSEARRRHVGGEVLCEVW
jgi:small subunit ribosomal protein S8